MLHPERLFLLLLLIPAALVLWLHFRTSRSMIQSLFGTWKQDNLIPVFTLKFILYSLSILLALLFLFLSLTGMLRENVRQKLPGKGLDVMIVLDISRSMMATDVEPSRLGLSRSLGLSFLGSSAPDRAGLVIFRGEAAVAVPLTEDKDAVATYLDLVQPAFLTSKGSDPAGALEKAVASFDFSEDRERMVLLFSDGELVGDRGGSLGRLRDDKDILFVLVGAGTAEGSTVRDGDELIRDMGGDVVITRLEEGSFQRYLEDRKGKVIRADNPLALTEIQDAASRLKKSRSPGTDDEWRPRYRPFLLLSLFFLMTASAVKGVVWKKIF